jgi:hypothetical protein
MRGWKSYPGFIGLALLAGCSGAQISLDHYSGDFGQTPPIPQSGGTGPALYKPAFEPPTDDFTVTTRLPELLAAYRLMLVDMGHVLPPGIAERQADAELAALRERHAGQDEALRAELIRRMRPVVRRPGTPAELGDKPARYPSDEDAARSEPQRRTP